MLFYEYKEAVGVGSATKTFGDLAGSYIVISVDTVKTLRPF